MAGNAKLPVVARVVNQGRLWKHALQTEFVGEQPDQSAAGRDDWTLIDATADADHSENLVLLERESYEHFPGNVDRVAGDITLKIRARIDLDSRAGVIVHHIFQSQ